MSPTEAALVAEYDAVLEREGLAALDHGTQVSKRGQPTWVQDEQAPATFLAWARDVLVSHAFEGPRDREVWVLHADGKSLNQIKTELGISRNTVKRSIARVKLASPPPPLINPWLKSQHEEAEEKRRQHEESWSTNGGTMQKPERKPIEYASIELKAGVDIPGLARKNRFVPMKDHRGMVQPLMGFQHAGGIDVLNVPTKDPRNPQRQTYTTVTVPWGEIKLAILVPLEREEVETAA